MKEAKGELRNFSLLSAKREIPLSDATLWTDDVVVYGIPHINSLEPVSLTSSAQEILRATGVRTDTVEIIRDMVGRFFPSGILTRLTEIPDVAEVSDIWRDFCAPFFRNRGDRCGEAYAYGSRLRLGSRGEGGYHYAKLGQKSAGKDTYVLSVDGVFDENRCLWDQTVDLSAYRGPNYIAASFGLYFPSDNGPFSVHIRNGERYRYPGEEVVLRNDPAREVLGYIGLRVD